MSVNSPCPIFIVGYMRSGTTLLLDILSRHPSVFPSSGETRFYDLLPTIKHAYPDLVDVHILREFLIFTAHIILLGNSPQNIFGKRLPLEDIGLTEKDLDILGQKAEHILEHGAILPLVFDYLAMRSSKSYWLEKTPTHIFYIDSILRFVPTASFVEIVRDPRSVLASKKVINASVNQGGRSFKHLGRAYDPLWDTLSWKSAIHAGYLARLSHPEKILSVRYEDLVTQKEITMMKICKFLTMKFEPDILDVRTRNTAYLAEKDFVGISNKFIDRWQTILHPGEFNFPQTLAMKEMRALGYVHIDTPLSSKLISLSYLFRSSLEFFLRLYRRYKLGGGNYLVNVVRNYTHRLAQLFEQSR